MNRRRVLASAAAWIATGCRARPSVAAVPMHRLRPVLVDERRVIDVTVGLRPCRRTGFRVDAEMRGNTLLVHNYGHGGAGMSLSWGTAAMAADLALPHPARTAAVLGAGVVGLTTARQLQRRGFTVTVYAAALPPDTTSNRSLATWSPTSALVVDRTPAFTEQYTRAAQVAKAELQRLVGRGYGVSWIDTYTLRRTQPQGPRKDRLGTFGVPPRSLAPEAHPFDFPFVSVAPKLRIEPGPYLDALLRDVRDAGGAVQIRAFQRAGDVDALPESVVVNCMGLGGGTLFGDTTVVPVKGQLVHLVPQVEVTYGLSGVESTHPDWTYLAPRADAVVLGGTARRGDASLEPDPDATASILAAHRAVFDGWRR